jgi:hypothetical protein
VKEMYVPGIHIVGIDPENPLRKVVEYTPTLHHHHTARDLIGSIRRR